jgi:hypothetical protein
MPSGIDPALRPPRGPAPSDGKKSRPKLPKLPAQPNGAMRQTMQQASEVDDLDDDLDDGADHYGLVCQALKLQILAAVAAGDPKKAEQIQSQLDELAELFGDDGAATGDDDGSDSDQESVTDVGDPGPEFPASGPARAQGRKPQLQKRASNTGVARAKLNRNAGDVEHVNRMLDRHWPMSVAPIRSADQLVERVGTLSGKPDRAAIEAGTKRLLENLSRL